MIKHLLIKLKPFSKQHLLCQNTGISKILIYQGKKIMLYYDYKVDDNEAKENFKKKKMQKKKLMIKNVP